MKAAVVAGALLAASVPAFAQTPVGPGAENQDVVLVTAETKPPVPAATPTRDECGVEPTSFALDPLLVECHARFAPIPPPTSEGAEELVRQLRLAATTEVSTSEPIALIILELDRPWWNLEIPKTRFIPVYRIKGSGGTETTVIGVANYNGSTQAYTAGKIRELLLPRETLQACDTKKRSGIAKTEKDPCVDLPEGVIYRPKLLLAKNEASLLFTPEAIKRHFHLETNIVQDVQLVMEDMTRLFKYN